MDIDLQIRGAGLIYRRDLGARLLKEPPDMVEESRRPRQPAESPHHHPIDALLLDIVEQGLQSRPFPDCPGNSQI
jgi:hypothetical protein